MQCIMCGSLATSHNQEYCDGCQHIVHQAGLVVVALDRCKDNTPSIQCWRELSGPAKVGIALMIGGMVHEARRRMADRFSPDPDDCIRANTPMTLGMAGALELLFVAVKEGLV